MFVSVCGKLLRQYITHVYSIYIVHVVKELGIRSSERERQSVCVYIRKYVRF